MGKVYGVNVVVGIPSFGMVSTYFLQARAAMQFPLVSSAIDKVVLKKPIAEARNEIVEYAFAMNANYIFWLDDDVIAPPNSFLKLLRHNKDIINGVYWSKSNPPMPLLFRNHLEGPYMNWHVGDLIEIDAAGSGLTLVKMDVYKTISEKIGGPWYSTDYLSFPGQSLGAAFSPPNNTEDLYFYWKAKKAGFKIWADTDVQAFHFDKGNSVLYAMPPNAPQSRPAWEIPSKGDKLIADIGVGTQASPWPDGEVVTFDIREEVKPDVICDVRYLPVPDQTFDIVFSSHTLEHFPWPSVDRVLKEWSRIIKVGGELRLVVPNLRWSARHILDDTMVPEDYWVLYGEQDYPKNHHSVGFTPNTLGALIRSIGVFDENSIEIREGDINGPPAPESWNLIARAVKIKHPMLDNIAPDDLEAPPPDSNLWWPMRVYEESTEKPVEETVDEASKGTPTKAGKKKREEALEVIRKVEKEKADGLEGDLSYWVDSK
jgi:predicted SAM-dependent methyltransferase